VRAHETRKTKNEKRKTFADVHGVSGTPASVFATPWGFGGMSDRLPRSDPPQSLEAVADGT
jgi:hypothetical protein